MTPRAQSLAAELAHRRKIRAYLNDAHTALPELWPTRFRWGFPPGAARSSILARYLQTPPVRPDRPPFRLLVEGARGLGKTEIAREVALHRLLLGDETGVLFVGRTPPDSAAHVRYILDTIPPVRLREPPDDSRVRKWVDSPLGALFPDARVSGGVEHAAIHVHGRLAHVWSRAPGGSIRGLNERGVRPSLVIADDLVTLEAALSPTQTETLRNVLDDDIGGLGTLETPVAIWLLGNAVAQGDLLDKLATSGKWLVERAPSWAPSIPPDSPEKLELLRLITAADATEDQARGYLDVNRDAILRGCRPTAPEVDPYTLLRLEAVLGARAFRQSFQCERTAAADRLWAMERAPLVEVRDGRVIWPDGAPEMVLAGCRAGVWLDPRGSDDADRNDYAAMALVVREPGQQDRVRRAVLRVDLARCRAVEQRAMLWRIFDHAVALGIPTKNIRVGYETNNAAKIAHEDFLQEDLRARRQAGKPAPANGIGGEWSSKGKLDIERIGRLEGPIEARRIGFHRDLLNTEAWQQCARLPHGEHDDAPDAIERADALTEIGDSMAARMRALRGG